MEVFYHNALYNIACGNFSLRHPTRTQLQDCETLTQSAAGSEILRIHSHQKAGSSKEGFPCRFPSSPCQCLEFALWSTWTTTQSIPAVWNHLIMELRFGSHGKWTNHLSVKPLHSLNPKISSQQVGTTIYYTRRLQGSQETSRRNNLWVPLSSDRNLLGHTTLLCQCFLERYEQMSVHFR